MMALEVFGGVVLLVLAVAATWMAVVGLLGTVGALRLRRCRSCGHLLAGSVPSRAAVCPYCRHPWLASHVVPIHLHHLLPQEMEPIGRPAPVSHPHRARAL
jgi:hypothetical protein